MAAYFFDTSALAKRYHPEAVTRTVDWVFQHPNSEIRISRLTVVEVPSVFAIKVRTGIIDRAQLGMVEKTDAIGVRFQSYRYEQMAKQPGARYT